MVQNKITCNNSHIMLHWQKTEQHHTVRDGQGNQETTIIRSIGDQTMSIKTKKTPSGDVERVEDYQNLEPGECWSMSH